MRRYALIGNPLGHSLSPQIHALINDVTGQRCDYRLMPMEQQAVESFIKSLPDSGIDGINVTIPHKLVAARSADVLSPEAQTLGAINTIAVDAGKTYGHNTDVHGFRAMLVAAGIAVAGRRCVVLGAGGSARAACAALVGDGAGDVLVVSRNPSAVAAPFPGATLIDYTTLEDLGGDVLVNCTPVGMAPRIGQSPVSPAVIGRFAAVADLVYNPRQTELLRIAVAAGLRIADGLYMLVAQAVRARAIWERAQYGEDVEHEVYDRMCIQWQGAR